MKLLSKGDLVYVQKKRHQYPGVVDLPLGRKVRVSVSMGLPSGQPQQEIWVVPSDRVTLRTESSDAYSN